MILYISVGGEKKDAASARGQTIFLKCGDTTGFTMEPKRKYEGEEIVQVEAWYILVYHNSKI